MNDDSISCPSCYALLEPTVSAICPVCGSEIAGRSEQKAVDTLPEYSDENPEPGAAATDADESVPHDELLEAFLTQFEERSVRIPDSWRRRLRDLAQSAEASRRFATLVFVDLREYTRFSNELGEEAVQDLRIWFNNTSTRAIEKHGGFVLQFLGDAIFAAFGAPWTFERDVESALKSLLEIHDAVEEYRGPHGETIAVRSGAASGVVNVTLIDEGGRSRPDLSGPAVNLAARLQAWADTGEIVVSRAVKTLVDGVFEFVPGTPFEPKNFGQVIEPFKLLGEKRQDQRRRSSDEPFIGRRRELESLVDVLSPTMGQKLMILVLHGEAGIGKTRLIQEAISLAPARIIRLDLESLHIVSALHAWRVLADRLLRGMQPTAGATASQGWTDQELSIVLGEAPDAVCLGIGAMLGIEGHTRRLARLPPADVRALLKGSVVELLKIASSKRPLAIVVDDAQWLDPLSRSLFQHVASSQVTGVSLVLALRDDQHDGCPEQHLLARNLEEDTAPFYWHNTPMITLAPLDDSDSQTLLDTVLEGELLHPTIRAETLTSATGIPLFLIELAKGGLTKRPSAGSSAAETHILPEVRSVEEPAHKHLLDVLQARVDRLSQEERLVFQCGSVLGRSFRQRILEDYERIKEFLLDALSTLRGRRFLETHFSSEGYEHEFKPPLLREVAYEMLPLTHRRQLHWVFAENIERIYLHRRDEMCIELADHWTRAGRTDRAFRYIRTACSRAMAFDEPRVALTIATNALAHLRDTDHSRQDIDPDAEGARIREQQRGLLHELAGRAARLAGAYALSKDHFEKWRKLSTRLANRRWELGARHQLAVTLFEAGNVDEALTITTTLLDEEHSDTLRAEVQCTHASLLLRKQSFSEAQEMAIGVAEAAHHSAPLLAADGHGIAGFCLLRTGDTPNAMAQFEKAGTLYAEVGSKYGECTALNMIGAVHELEGRLGMAQDYYTQAIERAEKCGYLIFMTAGLANIAMLNVIRDDAAQAREKAAASLSYARMLGHGNSELIALINLGLALERSGLESESLENLETAISRATELGDDDLAYEARIERAYVLLRFGHVDAAALALPGFQESAGEELAAHYATVEATIRAHAPENENVRLTELITDAVKSREPLGVMVRRLRLIGELAELGRVTVTEGAEYCKAAAKNLVQSAFVLSSPESLQS